MPEKLDALTRLNPVRFNFKNDITKSPDYGLIAEEVLEHMPELVAYDATGQIETVKYHILPSLLLAEIIRMKTEHKKEIDSLHNENKELRNDYKTEIKQLRNEYDVKINKIIENTKIKQNNRKYEKITSLIAHNLH